MNHGPIVLTEDGSNIFWAHDAWIDYCRKTGIEDPWQLMRECEEKVNKHWKEIDENGHTIWHADIHSKDEWPEDIRKEYKQLETYRDAYMIKREMWEGEYILKKFGYNTLIKFAQTHSQGETAPPYDRAFHEWFEKVYPCEGLEKQCNFACPVFNNCPYQEQGIYRNNVDYSAKWEDKK